MELKEFIEKARVIHGDVLPVVSISESLDEFDEVEDEFITRYSGEYLIDLEKINEDFEFRYVQFILEAAVINGYDRHAGSLKYSFTDTPDWWKDYHADSTEGRKVISIDVELNF